MQNGIHCMLSIITNVLENDFDVNAMIYLGSSEHMKNYSLTIIIKTMTRKEGLFSRNSRQRNIIVWIPLWPEVLCENVRQKRECELEGGESNMEM